MWSTIFRWDEISLYKVEMALAESWEKVLAPVKDGDMLESSVVGLLIFLEQSSFFNLPSSSQTALAWYNDCCCWGGGVLFLVIDGEHCRNASWNWSIFFGSVDIHSRRESNVRNVQCDLEWYTPDWYSGLVYRDYLRRRHNDGGCCPILGGRK